MRSAVKSGTVVESVGGFCPWERRANIFENKEIKGDSGWVRFLCKFYRRRDFIIVTSTPQDKLLKLLVTSITIMGGRWSVARIDRNFDSDGN